jgi:hypothetical protein
MIEIEKLHKFLNHDSKHREKQYAFRIPEKQFESGHIYGKYILDAKYSMIGKRFMDLPEWVSWDAPQLQYISEKLVPKNTFTSAILNSIMPEYRFFDLKTKLTFCSDLHRQIGYDMEQNSLYKDMGYARLRKEIREKFINVDDLDNDEKLKQVIIDYFSLTVYEISKAKDGKFGRNMEISRKGFVPLMWRKTEKNDEYLDKNISCFLLRLEDKYYSIVKRNTSGIFDFLVDFPEDIEFSVPIVNEEQEKEQELEIEIDSLPEKIPENIPEKKKVSKKKDMTQKDVEIIIKKQDNPEEQDKEPQKESQEEHDEHPEEESEPIHKIFIPKKITLKEIQDLAIQRDIPIQKKSEKTGKMLNKTIEELRQDILAK